MTTAGACSVADIKEMESRVMFNLGWRLLPQTSFAWVQLMIKHSVAAVRAAHVRSADAMHCHLPYARCITADA